MTHIGKILKTLDALMEEINALRKEETEDQRRDSGLDKK